MPIDPTAGTAVSSSDAVNLPTNDDMTSFASEVKATAYLLWEQAGRPFGREGDFWYRAVDLHIQARANAEKLDQSPPKQ